MRLFKTLCYWWKHRKAFTYLKLLAHDDYITLNEAQALVRRCEASPTKSVRWR